MKININEFKKWIAALDSGQYKQTSIGALNEIEDGKHYYCCLGVACKVLIDQEKIKTTFKNGSQAIMGGFPESQTHAPLWLKMTNNDFERKTGSKLSHLNDWLGFTFPEIATLLELVYIHKILD